MQPVTRGHAADADVPTTQNLLPDKCNHDGVINIVVGCVAGRNIFKSKLGDKANHTWIAGLQHPIGSFVHRPKFADKSVDNDLRWIEHRISHRIFVKMLSRAYPICIHYSMWSAATRQAKRTVRQLDPVAKHSAAVPCGSHGARPSPGQGVNVVGRA
jgi:hypothetical protein